MKKRVAIRAHGSKDPNSWFSGGFGLLQYFHEHAEELDGEIVLIVSPFEAGSVAIKTADFNDSIWSDIPYICLHDYSATSYVKIINDYDINLNFFSGWLKLVRGLESETCINIHPGPIQEIIWPDGQQWSFGGKGMRGDYVHRKVWEAYQAWIITSTAITMHYMTDRFDDPRYVIGQCVIPFLDTDTTWENPKSRLRTMEPIFQQYVCHQLVNGKIRIENDGVVIDDEVEFENAVFGGFGEVERRWGD